MPPCHNGELDPCDAPDGGPVGCVGPSCSSWRSCWREERGDYRCEGPVECPGDCETCDAATWIATDDELAPGCVLGEPDG